MLSLHTSTPKNLGKMVETKKVSIEFKTHVDVAVMEKIKLPINSQNGEILHRQIQIYKIPTHLSTIHNNCNLYYCGQCLNL